MMYNSVWDTTLTYCDVNLPFIITIAVGFFMVGIAIGIIWSTKSS